MFNNSWFKKEKPIQGLTGMWGGAAGALTVGAGGTFVATGGNMSYLPGPAGPTHYTVHTFVNGNTTGNPQGDPGTNDSSQSFVVTSGPGGISSFDYLVLGGGGGGGKGFNTDAVGGGGGGGGYREGTLSISLGAGTYPVQVGAGGHGGQDGPVAATWSTGAKGGDSNLMFPTPVVASGGGGGGSHFGPITQMDGGSGGGGGNPPAPPAPAGGETAASPDGISPTAQGNDGGSGTSYSSNTGGGGGGGSGGSGGNAS